MEVKHSKSYPNLPNYSIEWGYATWSKNELEQNKDCSIRNRYDRANGGYNYAGSSEVPWEDFKRMILESINENQFSKKELKSICKMIIKKFFKSIFKK